MTVLDTFYLLFKTDASGAKQDISKLDAQIADLAAKGQKRNQAEVEQLKQLRKQRQDLTQDLKDQQKTVEETGQAYVKLIEAATAAGAALVSFTAIKTGIVNAAELNSNLQIQAKLMGQNVTELRAYDSAAKAAGASTGEFIGYYQKKFQEFAAQGIPIPDVQTTVNNIRTAIKKAKSLNEKERIFQGVGISSPGLKALFEESDADFEKDIAEGRKHAQVTQEAADAAREYEKAWSKAHDSITSFWTTIDTELLPVFQKIAEAVSAFFDELSHNKAEANLFFGVLVTGATALAVASVGMIAGLLGMAGAAAAAAAPFIALAGAIGAVIAYADQIPSLGIVETGQGIGKFLRQHGIGPAWDQAAQDAVDARSGKGVAGSPPRSSQRFSAQDSVKFWMSQGFTREQAAGIAANEQRESGGNPAARGDFGQAVGLYQWHPDRVQKILAATGIDVRTASADDQRRAAAWELQNTGIADQLRATSSPDAAAALFSRQFERPANGTSEAILRGQQALGIASSTSFNSQSASSVTQGGDKNYSVQIGEIKVQTQATDAEGVAGSLGNALAGHIRIATSNIDDGVAY